MMPNAFVEITAPDTVEVCRTELAQTHLSAALNDNPCFLRAEIHPAKMRKEL